MGLATPSSSHRARPHLGKRLRIEITAIRADGSEFPVELAIAKISRAGRPLHGLLEGPHPSVERRERQIAERERLAEFGSDVGLILTERSRSKRCSPDCRVDSPEPRGASPRIWTVERAKVTPGSGLARDVHAP